MKFTLTIESDNAAMHDADDVARALRMVQRRLAQGISRAKIFDDNGDAVGSWSIEVDADSLCECGREPEDCATWDDDDAPHGDR